MKNKTTAALLALFLGGLGMHKFYLGKWVWGIVYLLFCWTFIPSLVSLVEAIVLLVQSEDSFQAKYGASALIMTASGLVHATPKTHIKCPDCRELIIKDARKCKYCGCRLVPDEV